MFFIILTITASLIFLVYPSVQVWRARSNDDLRARIEKRFDWLMKGSQGLFDKNSDYTWLVQWIQWGAIPTAILIIIPGELFWNIVAGTVWAVILYISWHTYFWWKPSKPSKSSAVAKSTAAE